MRRPAKPPALEHLESRHLLATLISPQIVRFQDLDGDTVDVALSRPVLTAANVDSVFRFTAGGVSGDNSIRQGLLDIRLSEVLAGIRGVNLQVLVSARAAGGSSDGAAAVGHVSAEGIDLGNVRIDGSLGRIRAGDANLLTPGLRRLTTISLGEGTVPKGGDYRSVIQGRVDAIRSVDIRGSIDVQGREAGQIGSIELFGSIVGGAADGSGSVTASGPIGTVSIDSLLGGAGNRSGRIEASRFDSIRTRNPGIGLRGGDGNESGSIAATGRTGIGTIDVSYVVGGSGDGSGAVSSAGGINRLTTTALEGAAGERSGSVTARGTINTARASVLGGAGAFSGVISAADVRRVTSSTVRGGSGMNSGAITTSGSIGRAQVIVEIKGGTGAGSGVVRADGVITRLDAQSITGGGGTASGGIYGGMRIDYVRVSGTVSGGDGRLSGSIGSAGKVGFVSCDRLVGGDGEMSGSVYAQRSPGAYSPPQGALEQRIDWVKVGREIRGGAGTSSGSIVANHFIDTVTVTDRRGRLVGGGGRDSGTVRSGDWSGTVPAFTEYQGSIAQLNIPLIVGGDGGRSGAVLATGFVGGRVDAEILGGAGDDSGTVVGSFVGLPFTRDGRTSGFGTTVIRGGSGHASGSVRGLEGVLNIRDLIGGEGERSGSLEFSRSLTVKGHDIRGGAGSYTGRVSAPSLTLIAQRILGGSASGAADLVESGAVVAELLEIQLGGRTVGGPRGVLQAGTNTTSGVFKRNGAIVADTISGTLGHVNGNDTNPAIVAAVKGIGSLSERIGEPDRPLVVTGNVYRGLIVAGRGFEAVNPRTGLEFGTNPDARIRDLRIKGNFDASSIAAGVRPVDAFYGNADDARVGAGESYPDDPAVSSRIDKVMIEGSVRGTSTDGDSYGIVAEAYGVVYVGRTGAASWRNVYRDPRGPSRIGPVDDATGDVFLVSLGRS